MKALRLGLVLGVAAIGSFASPAFAGLELVGTGVSQSWSMTFTVNQSGGIGNVPSSFDKIVATNGGSVNYTVSSQNFSISDPSIFEDLGTSGAHLAWSFGTGGGGWAQTDPTPSSTASNVNQTTAAGTAVNPATNPITFTLFFTGDERSDIEPGTNGAHFFLTFFSGSSYVTQYEVKDIKRLDSISANGTHNYTQGTEITQIALPLPAAAWCGLIMMGGLGGAYAMKRRHRVLA